MPKMYKIFNMNIQIEGDSEFSGSQDSLGLGMVLAKKGSFCEQDSVCS
jgi:hypothetical protein